MVSGEVCISNFIVCGTKRFGKRFLFPNLFVPQSILMIAALKENAAPGEYDISEGTRAALTKIFRLEYDLYNFLKQRLVSQVTEVCKCNAVRVSNSDRHTNAASKR